MWIFFFVSVVIIVCGRLVWYATDVHGCVFNLYVNALNFLEAFWCDFTIIFVLICIAKSLPVCSDVGRRTPKYFYSQSNKFFFILCLRIREYALQFPKTRSQLLSKHNLNSYFFILCLRIWEYVLQYQKIRSQLLSKHNLSQNCQCLVVCGFPFDMSFACLLIKGIL